MEAMKRRIFTELVLGLWILRGKVFACDETQSILNVAISFNSDCTFIDIRSNQFNLECSQPTTFPSKFSQIVNLEPPNKMPIRNFYRSQIDVMQISSSNELIPLLEHLQGLRKCAITFSKNKLQFLNTLNNISNIRPEFKIHVIYPKFNYKSEVLGYKALTVTPRNISVAVKSITQKQGSKSQRQKQDAVIVTTNEDYPFVFNKPNHDGVDIRILKIAADKLNFKYKFTSPADGEWGRVMNGSWTGMVGMLVNNEADIAITGIMFNIQRNQAVDFTVTYLRDETIFLSPVPQPLLNWKSILRPFSFYIWLLIVISLSIATVLLHFTSVATESSEENLSLSTSFLICVKIISSETVLNLTSENASRLVLATWMAASFFIIKGYGGILTSFLMYPLKAKPILTIEELLADPTMSWGMILVGGAPSMMFTESPVPNFQSIWAGMEFISSPEPCIRRTSESRFACIIEISDVNPSSFANFEEPPSFLVSRDNFQTWQLGICFRKNFYLYDQFNMMVMHMIESGIITKMYNDFSGVDLKRLATKEEGNTVLTLDHLMSAFYLWLLGVSVATVVFFAEGMKFKYFSNKRA